MAFHTTRNDENPVYKGETDKAAGLSFEIAGALAPVLDVTLKPGQGLVCDQGAVLKRDARLVVNSWPGIESQRQLLVNSQVSANLTATLMLKGPGAFGAFDLSEYGRKLICPATGVIGNEANIAMASYARFPDIGVHMVQLQGEGLVFLAGRGDVFETRLAPGEKTCVNACSIAALTATVDFDRESRLQPDQDGTGQADAFVTLTGPGTVWLQSIPVQSLQSGVSSDRFKVRNLPERPDAGLAIARRNGS